MTGRREHPRADHRRTLSETEKKIIDYLDVVATHVGALPPPPPKNAGELDRALQPAWESVAFKKVDVKTGREGLLREREGRARTRLTAERTDVATTALGDIAIDGRRLRGVACSLGARLARAWRRNARRLPFPHALADRLLRPDARADARLALSLLHRLRSPDPAALGGAEELRIRLLPGRAARQRALGHVSLRALVGAAEARRRAGARHGARPRHARRRPSTAPSSICRRCSARRSPSPSCGG